MRCSVVIPAYNAEEILEGCLRALVSQTIERSDYEIIVIDDGSTDHTAAVARQYADQVETVSNAGPGLARNRGAQLARVDIIVFTDSDCVPEPDFLEKLLAPFDDPEIVGAKGSYLSRQKALTARFVQAEYEDRYRYMHADARIDFIDTYAAAFRRETFLAAGGYSALFPFASVEDQEFSFRLAHRGATMVFVPAAQVWHRHADTFFGYVRKKYKIAFWKVLVLRLHPGKSVKDSHTPQRIKVQILLTPLAFLGLGSLLGVAPWWTIGFTFASIALEGPFIREQWDDDQDVALATPLYVWGRSLAFALGMLRGTLRFWHITGTTTPSLPGDIDP